MNLWDAMIEALPPDIKPEPSISIFEWDAQQERDEKQMALAKAIAGAYIILGRPGFHGSIPDLTEPD